MMRRLSFAALACALLLSGCATAPGSSPIASILPQASNDPVIKSVPKEFKPSLSARGVELDLNDRRSKEFGLMTVPALSDYLNGLLDRIKAEAGLPGIPARVHLTVRSQPEHQATADGNIYLSATTVAGFESEAEVVAMLAHELGHVVFGHFDVDVASSAQKQVHSTIEIVKKMDDMLGGKTGKPLSPSQEKALKRIRMAIEVTDKVLIPAFSREQERTADRFAIDITRRLGYPYGAGLKVMLEKLASTEEEQNKKAEAEQQKEMEKLVEAGFQNPNNLFGDLRNFFVDAAIDTVSKTHYSADTRMEEAKAYNDRFYPRSPGDSDRKDEWKKVLESKTVSKILANYASAREVDGLIEKGELDKALAAAKKAVEKPTTNHAFPQFMLAKAYHHKGDRKNAGAWLKKAISSPEPLWEAFVFLSEFQRDNGQREAAAKVLQEGFVKLGKPANKRPDLIRFHVSVGAKDKVKAMEMECHALAPRLREDCSTAAASEGWGLEKAVAQRKKKM